MGRIPVVAACVLLAACAKPQPAVVVYPADQVPEQLSAWGVLISDGKHLELNTSVLAYELNTPLFTDYAQKLRTVWMPPGEAAGYDANIEFDFPVGTIISKTFHYEKATGWSDTSQKVVRQERDAKLDDKGRLDLGAVTVIETPDRSGSRKWARSKVRTMAWRNSSPTRYCRWVGPFERAAFFPFFIFFRPVRA